LTSIGVLALQGDFAEHIGMLQKLGVDAREVRLPSELYKVDGLIIPGGESTTMAKLLDRYEIAIPLTDQARQGMPIWGTCAGMILLARELEGDRPKPLGLLDIQVARNAFGRQIDSFEEDLKIPDLGNGSFHAVFIRAPVVTKVGLDVSVLARLHDDTVVAVRQGGLLGTAFHPELSEDIRFHEYFSNLVSKA
jgi:5'-phosphate synthase pdxT subunit